MKGHHSTPLNHRDLTSRLTRIKTSYSLPNDGDAVSRLPRMSSGRGSREPGTSSFTSSRQTHDLDLTHLPAFSKSSTMSTNASGDSAESDVSGLQVRGMCTFPISARTHKESVEVRRGEFSKPRVAKRRHSNEIAKSEGAGEFRYYGRHANSWLFNDFSITGSVRKGWGKVLSGKEGGEEH